MKTIPNIITTAAAWIAIPLITAACSCGTRTETPAARQAAQDTAAAAPAPLPQETDAVSGATAVPKQRTFNGIIDIPAHDRATVTLNMGGTVRSASFLPGDYIRKGEVIATLASPEFIDLQQSYLEASARLEYLALEYGRQASLSRSDASSRKKLEQSKAEYLSMKSKAEAYAAHLAILGIDTSVLKTGGILQYLEAKAPIGGYVTSMSVNIGKHIAAGEPLCEIIDKSAPMLRLTAYEKDLPGLSEGDSLVFTANGDAGRTYEAVIMSLDQRVDASSRSVQVYARILGNSEIFRPGMYVTATGKQKN